MGIKLLGLLAAVAAAVAAPEAHAQCEEGCPEIGDFNQDCKVGIRDLSILNAHWDCTSCGPTQGDANGDGSVDQLDYEIYQSNFGATCSDASSLPVGARPTWAYYTGESFHADTPLSSESKDWRQLKCEHNTASVGWVERFDTGGRWTFDSGQGAACMLCYEGPTIRVKMQLRILGYFPTGGPGSQDNVAFLTFAKGPPPTELAPNTQLTFNENGAGPDTIVADSGAPFLGLEAWDYVQVKGSACSRDRSCNDKTYGVQSATANTITLHSEDDVTQESCPAGSCRILKAFDGDRRIYNAFSGQAFGDCSNASCQLEAEEIFEVVDGECVAALARLGYLAGHHDWRSSRGSWIVEEMP